MMTIPFLLIPAAYGPDENEVMAVVSAMFLAVIQLSADFAAPSRICR
jgi:hypothetical protein